MGITDSSLERYFFDKKLFENKDILTLGTLHPYLSIDKFNELKTLFPNISDHKNSFAKEIFLTAFGANSVTALDVDDYQESNIIHNLNLPIPEKYYGKFDLIIDAGTVEHISNIAQFYQNVFRLLKLKGAFYFGTVSNSWVNHGFFQFSASFIQDFVSLNNYNLKDFSYYIGDTKKLISHDNESFRLSKTDLKKKITLTGIIEKTHNNDLKFC